MPPKPKRNTNTGGNTQNIEAEAPAEKKPKPKVVASFKVQVYDDGSIDSDFHGWAVDDNERRKQWRMGGVEWVKMIYSSMPPKILRILTSALNVQVVLAGLPEDMQGSWLARYRDEKTGEAKIKILAGAAEIGDALVKAAAQPAPLSPSGDKLTQTNDTSSAKALGLPAEA